MQKILLFAIAFFFIFFAINNKGIITASEKSNNDYLNEQLKNTDVSGGISKEEAVALVKKHILADKKLQERYSVNKAKVDRARLSEGYWTVSFPLKFWHKPLLGLIPDWGVFYVDIKTGEVKGGGETFDL